MRHAFPSNIAAHWQSPPSAHVPWCEHRSHESRTPLVAAVDRSTVRVSARNALKSAVVADAAFAVEGVDGRQDILILILPSFVVTRASGARRVAVAGDHAGTVHRGGIVRV